MAYKFGTSCESCSHFSIGSETGEIKTGSQWSALSTESLADEVILTVIAYDMATDVSSRQSETYQHHAGIHCMREDYYSGTQFLKFLIKYIIVSL